jgi:hypothetical protein
LADHLVETLDHRDAGLLQAFDFDDPVKSHKKSRKQGDFVRCPQARRAIDPQPSGLRVPARRKALLFAAAMLLLPPSGLTAQTQLQAQDVII